MIVVRLPKPRGPLVWVKFTSHREGRGRRRLLLVGVSVSEVLRRKDPLNAQLAELRWLVEATLVEMLLRRLQDLLANERILWTVLRYVLGSVVVARRLKRCPSGNLNFTKRQIRVERTLHETINNHGVI